MEGPEDLDADWSNGSYECVDCPPGNKHPRRSKKGVPPKRCPQHKAEKYEREKVETLNKLREERGRKPIPVPGEPPAEPEPPAPEPDPVGVVEPLPAPSPHERTWLDDDDAQELLRQKREREVTTGVAYDPEEHGTVEEFLARAAESFERPTDEPDVPGPEHPAVLADLDGPTADNPEPFATATDRVNELRDQHRPDNDDICRVDGCGSEAVHVNRICGPHWQRVGLDERGILLGTQLGSTAFEQTLRRVLIKLRN